MVINEAKQQAARHSIGRYGEAIAQKYLGGELTSHKEPLDLVDWGRGRAYEIKTVNSDKMESAIRIKPPSLKRKIEFADRFNLEIVMISIVVYDRETDDVEIYGSILRTSVKPRWMKLLKKRNQPIVMRQRSSVAQLTGMDRLPTFEELNEDTEGNKTIAEFGDRVKERLSKK